MPALYQGTCSACATVTERIFGSYEAVFLDAPSTRADAHPEVPALVVLKYPFELDTLRELGLTGRAAHWTGRIVEIDRALCRSCGALFEVRRLSAGWPALGLWGGLAAAAGILAFSIGLGILIGGEWEGFVVGGCLLVLLLGMGDQALGWLVRWRYRERAARIDTPPCCPACGDFGCDKLERLRLDPVNSTLRARCPACGAHQMTYRIVGVV